MKSIIVAFCLVMAVSMSVLATDMPLKNKAFWNPVTIYNDADYGINYRFGGGKSNFISPGKKDTYHSGIAETNVQILLQGCAAHKYLLCTDSHFKMSDERYNVELIKTIHIYSVEKIQVTCLDGGTTSCLVKQ